MSPPNNGNTLRVYPDLYLLVIVVFRRFDDRGVEHLCVCLVEHFVRVLAPASRTQPERDISLRDCSKVRQYGYHIPHIT